MAHGAISSLLVGTLLPPLHYQLAPYCQHTFSSWHLTALLPLSVFRRSSMVTYHVPHTLYGYVTAADWGSALCCSALPMMARDLSSHLVLHAGAFSLPEVWRSGPLVVLVALG